MTNGGLQATDVVKSYNKKEVLHSVSLTIEPGKIYGLIGRNGAGKTTLLSILTAQNTHDSGLVTYNGERVWENQKALEEKEFTAAAGGGVVEVTISGKKEVTKVSLKEEVVDPDDIEMLEDLIMAATNEALRKVEEETNAVMSKLTGGLTGMGGGFPF